MSQTYSDYPETQTQTSSIVMIDFAGGWRYGFPRQFLKDNDQQGMVDWLTSKGVPVWLAVQEQNNLRIWSVPTGASTNNFPPVNEKLQ